MYQTNTSLEVDGVTMEVTPTISLKIARAGGANTEYAKVATEVFKPYRAVMDKLSDEDFRKLQATIYARTVVRSWIGVTDAKDQELECTEENIIRLLCDLPDLFAAIQLVASDANGFRDKLADETAGKSATG
jgi:hypothetical protein